MTPANEVPPVTTVNASGVTTLTIAVTRDATGNVTGGTINFLTSFTFPGSITVTGLHIHEGSATVSAGVVFNTGLSSTNTLTFATGSGVINLNSTSVDVAILNRLLANPAGFYVNLHTSVNPGGVIRGQISKLVEIAAQTVIMNTAEEIPAPAPAINASATGTITAYPTRNMQTGAVTGGVVNFSITYNFPGSVTFTGLHIHEAAIGVAGPVVIGTSLSGSNPVVSATGKGTINLNVPILTAAQLGAFTRMLANPAGFYVNIHTNIYPGGVVRAQLSSLALPPYIGAVSSYLGTTGNQPQMISVTALNIDPTSIVVINGQPVPTNLDLNSGALVATIPASLLANPGVLVVQVRNTNGLLSQPSNIVIAAGANSVATTVDAARFADSVSPESIAAAFGAKLSTNTVSATTAVLPVILDGTSVYVNGVLSSLFFVSPGQINYQIPPNTITGPARVVVVASDGTVSTGLVNVTNTAPAIFTRTANGLGAPAAVASVDGQVFNINVSNPDGTPVAINAGNFVSLFGTGFRFASAASTITIGGVAVTPLSVSAQGQFIGLDQINLQIPQSLAGRGDVDLIITTDGKTSNTVKLKVN